MTKNNPENLELLKHHSQRAFEKANPKIWGKFQRERDKIKRIREIVDRTKEIQGRMKDHIKKHRTNWVAREMVRLYEKRQHLTLEHPAPRWAANEPVHVSYLEDARKNVQSRIIRRMKRISRIQRDMLDRVSEIQAVQASNPQNLKSSVHAIVNRTQAVRAKAKRHFTRHKNQWITKAREKGSKTPERDIFKKQSGRLNRIDKAEHRLIHNAFQEYGQSLPQTQKPPHAPEFDQSMG